MRAMMVNVFVVPARSVMRYSGSSTVADDLLRRMIDTPVLPYGFNWGTVSCT